MIRSLSRFICDNWVFWFVLNNNSEGFVEQLMYDIYRIARSSFIILFLCVLGMRLSFSFVNV